MALTFERSEPISLLTSHGQIWLTLVTGDGQMCVVIEEPTDSTEILVRVQSSCMFSESLGAIDCDCNSQLKESLSLVKEHGGIVVYLFEEGRGIGLEAKFQAVRLQQQTGRNTAEVFAEMGQGSDPRDYTFVARVLTEILGPDRSAILMTNNPTRRAALIAQGVSIARTQPLIIRTATTEGYLAGKAEALGHEV